MKKHGLILGAALLTLASCSERQATEAGEGSVNFRPEVALQIEDRTRATVTLPEDFIPADGDFSLVVESKGLVEIEGEMKTYRAEYTKFSGYDNPQMPAGDYKATIHYGNAEAEGPAAYCYDGTVDFTIVARKTIETSIPATLTNSIISLQLGEWFGNYYEDAEFVVRTESGNEFTFDETTTAPVFIKPGTEFYLSGKATKIRNGAQIEFTEKLAGTSAARTWHKIAVELKEVGGVHFMEIRLDDTLEPIWSEEVELNPEV